MRRLDLRPIEARYDDDLVFTFRRLTMPDMVELVRGTAMEAAIFSGGEVSIPEAEALELCLRIVDMLAIGWTVVDHEDAPLPVTRAAVAQLITEDPRLIAWLIEQVFAPAVEGFALLDAEKNASAPSPDGTTAGAETTARRARKPAKRARKSWTGRAPTRGGRCGISRSASTGSCEPRRWAA